MDDYTEAATRGNYNDVISNIVLAAKDVVDSVANGEMILRREHAEIRGNLKDWQLWMKTRDGYTVILSSGKVLHAPGIQENVNGLQDRDEMSARLTLHSLIGWLRAPDFPV